MSWSLFGSAGERDSPAPAGAIGDGSAIRGKQLQLDASSAVLKAVDVIPSFFGNDSISDGRSSRYSEKGDMRPLISVEPAPGASTLKKSPLGPCLLNRHRKG